MSKLYIVRGLPGSGKTTLAARLARQLGLEHWEADMYHVDKEGNYKFNPENLSAAHDWCIGGVEDAMFHRVDVMIVSNTFTRASEMEDYLMTASRLGVEVYMIECTKDYGSIHGVPEKTLQKMRARWVPNSEFAKFADVYSNLDEELIIHYQTAEDYA